MLTSTAPHAEIGFADPAGNRGSVTRISSIGLAVAIAIALTCIHLVAQLKGPGWSSPLLIGDHLFALGFSLVLLLYCYATGRALFKTLLTPFDEPLTAAIVAIGLGMGAISTLILFMGFARLYYGGVFLLVGLALTIALRRDLARAVAACMGFIPRVMGSTGFGVPSRGQAVAIALIVVSMSLVMIRLAVPMSANVSGTDWDGLVYHVESARLYIQAHGFIPLPGIPLANAPAGEDMLFIPGLFAGVDTLAKVLNVPLVILLGLATYDLGRRNFSPAAGWLGAIILFNTIWLLPIIPTSLTDIAPAVMLVQAVGDIICWVGRIGTVSRAASAGRSSWARLRMDDRLLIRAGLLAGIASAMRLTDLPATLAIPLLVGLMSLCCLRRGPVERLAWAIRNGTITGIAMLIPLSPWLAKNQFFFGNPMYPQTAVGNAVTNGGAPIATLTPVVSSRIDHILWLLSTLPQLAWEYATPLSLVVIVAPLVLRRATAYGLIGFILIAGALWLQYVPIYLPPRYMLVFVAAICVATAATISAISDVPYRIRRLALVLLTPITVGSGVLWLTYVPFSGGTLTRMVLVVGAESFTAAIIVAWKARMPVSTGAIEFAASCFLCVNSFLGFLFQYDAIQKNNAIPVLTGSMSRDEYLSTYTWYFRAYSWVNAHTPPTTAVAVVHITATYYLDRPFVNDWYAGTFSALQNFPLERQPIFSAWCERHVSILVFNRRLNQLQSGLGEMSDDVRPLSAFAWLRFPGLDPRLLYSAHGVDVLRINPCAATSPVVLSPTGG